MSRSPAPFVRVAAPDRPQPRAGLRLADIVAPGANSFSVLRLAMAVAVLVSHSYWLATGQGSAEPLVSWTGHSLGEHAVQVFFFMSGLLVAQSLIKSGSVLDFACGRALRILPGLLVCVLLTAFLLGPLTTTLGLKDYLLSGGVPAYLARTLSLSTGSAPLPGVFADLPVAGLVNLSLWTLKFEVLCYLLLAAIGVVWLSRPLLRPAITVALALVVALVFAGQPKPAETYTALDNLRYFSVFFFAGVLAFLWRERITLTWLALPPLALVFALAIGTRFGEAATALFLGYGALLAATLPLGPLRRLADRHDLSYGVYIYACPVQQALIQLMPGIAPVELTLIALPIALGLAMLSFDLVERPAMERRAAVVAWLRRRLLPAAVTWAPRSSVGVAAPVGRWPRGARPARVNPATL